MQGRGSCPALPAGSVQVRAGRPCPACSARHGEAAGKAATVRGRGCRAGAGSAGRGRRSGTFSAAQRNETATNPTGPRRERAPLRGRDRPRRRGQAGSRGWLPGLPRAPAGLSPVPPAPALGCVVSLPFPSGECINRNTEGKQYVKSTFDEESFIFQDTNPLK